MLIYLKQDSENRESRKQDQLGRPKTDILLEEKGNQVLRKSKNRLFRARHQAICSNTFMEFKYHLNKLLITHSFKVEQ